MSQLETNGTVRDKDKIIEIIRNCIGKLCMFDIYKENHFAFGTQGKLTVSTIENNVVFYDIKGFNFTADSIDNVCYFGVVLRIQIRP